MQLETKIRTYFYLGCMLLLLLSRSSLTKNWQSKLIRRVPSSKPHNTQKGTQPLTMKGGDPYIRALMRTITASEANVARPYNVLYGGKYINDLRTHPEICIAIVSGPNVGKCTTAAGRYQMLDFTWKEKAQKYHPNPTGLWRWQNYSFEAKYQDIVVYNWLSDSLAWDTDIPQLLRQGDINSVLRLLSGTWTSLGYGIETNSMSRHLPSIYWSILREELS